MSCSCKFGETLRYVSPGHGGWGLVRIGALIPESYLLFVSPFACGRHGALGGVLNGIKDKASFLYIDEADIVSGGYEDLIPEAVEELLDFLEKRPKVILIFVTCIDDLLGTDHIQLNQRLSKRFPDVKFMSCHMNPINENMKLTPAICMQRDLYSLLEKTEDNVNAINFIGNHSAVSRDCELYEIAERNGYQMRHISDFARFEDYLTMAQSKYNLVLSPIANVAAEQMQEKLGIGYQLAYNTYDLDEIRAFYQTLAETLGLEIDVRPYEARARQKLKEAAALIGDYPIAIDYQAVKKPFTLARVLLEYGFNVEFMLIDAVKKIERADYEYIVANHKNIEIVNAIHPDMIKHAYRGRKNYLCIGFDCAYATGSDKVLGILNDEFLFGYYGVEKLMTDLMDTFVKETDVEEMIAEARLII